MMGTGTFAEPTLEALLDLPDLEVVGVFTQPDRDTGIQRGSTRLAQNRMKELGLARQIPVCQPERVNAPEGVRMLRDLQPDLLVVAAYGQILSAEVLSVPAHGAINVHASLLPKYRGAAPIAWAIYHGEAHSGVTIIRISTGLDAGAMLAQESVLILPDETAGELEKRLAPLGARMALQVIGQMRSGEARATPQDAAAVTKAPKLTKQDGQVDWRRPAPLVQAQIRAMQPWPQASTHLHRAGKEPLRVILCRARVVPPDEALPGEALPGEPGSVQAAGNRLRVRCGGGAVEVLELHPVGKKKMLAEEFLRGYRIQPGDRFADAATPGDAPHV